MSTLEPKPTEEPKFSPASIGPSIEEMVKSRLHFLQGLLWDKDLVFQRKNILSTINLYESGKLPSAKPTVWIMD